MRRLLVDEAGGRCAVCSYDRCGYNLHFHHVNAAEKSVEMSMHTGKALATYRAEARKCVLVCANCHGEIETGTIPSPPAGAKYGEDWTGLPKAHSGVDARSAPDEDRGVVVNQLELAFACS